MNIQVENLINEGQRIIDTIKDNFHTGIPEFKSWSDKIKLHLESEGYPESEKGLVYSVLNVQVNPFSTESSKKEMRDAISRVNHILASKKRLSMLNKPSAILVVESILRNFYKYYEEMFQKSPHRSGTLQLADLQKIQIGNEYDVQRMLYSLIKPVFPNARLEVPSDTGYRSVRFDILIDEYDITIEVKCTSNNLAEKKLIDQIATDIVHYNIGEVFFFIFDKEKVISNVDAFEKQYTRKFGAANIKTYVARSMNY